MVIYKAYKFRVYPDREQKEIIDKSLGSKRFVYNYFLDKMKSTYQNNHIILSSSELFLELRKLKVIHPWLKDIDAKILNMTIFDLQNLFKRNLSNISSISFKKKDFHESYKTNNYINEYMGFKYDNIRLDLKNKEITLPRLKCLKISGYRKMDFFTGKILNATISKESYKYFISILVEVPFTTPKFIPRKIIGLDLGIKDFVVTSDAEKIKCNIKNYEKKLQGLQKKLARCKTRSKNSYKVKMKIQRLWLKIKNSRKYLIHNISNKFLHENDIIAIETLNVKEMYQIHSIAKKLTNVPISELFRVIEYKARWLGKKVIAIDKYFPSSQLCSRCNFQNKNIKNLSIREWECPRCKSKWDRDINASINIMFEGLKIYYGFNKEFSI